MALQREHVAFKNICSLFATALVPSIMRCYKAIYADDTLLTVRRQAG